MLRVRADVTVCHLQSKSEAYELFGQVSRQELSKAQAEEVGVRACVRLVLLLVAVM
jgi:hypothetical protein